MLIFFLKNNSIISMITLSDFFQQQQSISIQQLQNKVFSNKATKREQTRSPPLSSQPSDLKILSPFYQRINQHPQNCKCMYHKRVRSEIKKVGRFRTQPNVRYSDCKENFEGRSGHLVNEMMQIKENLLELEQNNEAKPERGDNITEDFKEWMNNMTSEELNRNYCEYLKSLPSFEKFKRHEKLDCHNLAFEEFLKSRYLVILDKKKSQNQLFKENKENHSRKLVSRLKTEGHISRDKIQTNKTLNNNGRQLTQISVKGFPSLKDIHKKKIGFKEAEKELQLSDGDDPGDRKQKRKRTKYISSRPSFFGLIEDQQLLKQLCMRFMNENRNQNKEAELMVKQLVQSDLDMYVKIMNDIQQDLEEGIVMKHLDQNTTNKLIKIILHKISKSVQAVKNKDQSFEEKNNIIEELCSKYGWDKEEKSIGLQEFWKIAQSMKYYSNSRKSLAFEKGSKVKLERGSSLASSHKVEKDRKNRSKIHRESGFFAEKSLQKFSVNSPHSKNIMFKETDEAAEPEKEVVQQQFRINVSQQKNILKKGGLMKRKRGKKLSTLQDAASILKNKSLGNNLVRKQTCFYKLDGEKDLPSNDEEHLENQRVGVLQNDNLQKEEDDRNSSMFLYLKSQVMRHIEANKKFLRRIENQLVDKECNQFVIGIGTGILTKKRKIRAIYDALEKEKDKESGYYNDLLKYLQIYEQYCDLVVKMKKPKKTNKTENSHGKYSDSYFMERTEEDIEQIDNLMKDLRKERELKYMDLKWMQEEEDPKEQIIIKMPEYNTQVDKLYEKHKKMKITEEREKVQVKFIEFSPPQCTIMQKNLEYRVSMSLQVDSNNLRHTTDEAIIKENLFPNQQFQEEEECTVTERDFTTFQRKILKYRNQLQLFNNSNDL